MTENSTPDQKIEVGDRYEDLDVRQGTRVIRIIEAPTLSKPARYVVEVAEHNPKTVGNRHRIKASVLLQHYRKVSR